MTSIVAEPFSIEVSPEEIAGLRSRLERPRWLEPLQHDDWSDGTDYDYLRLLVEYWKTSFDWRAQEQRLNRLPQYRMRLRGLNIHYIHIRSGRPDAIPLLICHGWPGGINEFEKLAALLMERDRASLAFDLVIPSMPGFGFSDAPRTTGIGVHYIADMWRDLMLNLGYERFGVQGGDWGSWVAIALSRRSPDRVLGAHLNYVSARYLPALNAPASQEERDYLELGQRWASEEAGYIQIQATKPQTLGFALTDSPVGLAAWIIEKFHGWSSAGNDLESVFSKDELLTNVSLYWFSNAIYSSTRIYKEARADALDVDWSYVSPVPVAVARFPDEIPFPPRSHVGKYLNIQRWTPMRRGGHFAALESPAELAEDIRAFFATA